MNYHPLTQQQYEDLAVDLISSAEGHIAVARRPPGDPNTTIGYGYTFNRGNNLQLWQAAGISLTQAESALLASIDTAPAAQRNGLALQFARSISKSEAVALLRQTYGAYEGPAISLGMPLSRERAALVSITYNRGAGSVRRRMTHFLGAVQAGDRAEAWFQLRYLSWGTNTQNEAGLRARRLVESEVFGLYDEGAVSPQDASSVYRMLELHRDEILSLEAQWGVNPNGTPGTRNLIAEVNADPRWSSYHVSTLVESLMAARESIVHDVAAEYGLTAEAFGLIGAVDVYVDPGRARVPANQPLPSIDPDHAYVLDSRHFVSQTIEEGSNDLLIGEGGRDVLIAGLGDDVLIGGTGDDVLEGGIGNDAYLFQGGTVLALEGDGQDVIRDADGLGSIRIGDLLLSGVDAQAFLHPLSQALTETQTQTEPRAWRWTVDGQTFNFILVNGTLSGGTLWIEGDGVGLNGRIVIENFHQGDLGLFFPRNPALQILLASTGTENPFADPEYQPTTASTTLLEGQSRTLTLALNAPASANQIVRMSVSQLGGALAIVSGAQTLSLSNGYVDLALEAGQTTVSVALLSQGDVDSDQSLTLSAVLLDGQGQPISSSSALDVSFDAQQELSNATAETVYVVDASHGLGGTATGVFGSLYGAQLAASHFYSWNVFYAYDSPDRRRSEVIDMTLGAPEPGDDYLTVEAGLGDSYIVGSAYRDSLSDGINTPPDGGIYYSGPTGDDDTLLGGGGDDYLLTHGGDDRSYGGEGNDFIADIPIFFAGPAAAYMDIDWVNWAGHSNRDQLYGEAGNDIIVAGAGDALLDGGTGNDELYGGAGNDTLLGGSENDVLSGDSRPTDDFGVYSPGVLTVGFRQPYYFNGQQIGTTGSIAEEIIAPGNDFLDGGDGDDYLIGGGGDDVLMGGEGTDTLQGDTLVVPSDTLGFDTNHGTTPLELQGDDRLYGEGGADHLRGGAGSDLLDGGVGDDYLVGDEVDEFAGNDLLHGGDGNDTLLGEGGNDTLMGGADNDELYGESSNVGLTAQGNDYIDGGAGDDILVGGGGADTLIGGTGDDQLFGDQSTLPSALQLGDLLDGGEGNDVLQGHGGDDTLLGGAGDDQLYGGTGEDVLDGGEGFDELYGGDGDDLIFAQQGDTVDGGAGDDRIISETGATIVDTQGENTLTVSFRAGGGLQMVSTVGGGVLLFNAQGESVVISQQTLAHLTALDLGAAGTYESGDEMIRRLYQPTTLVSNEISLGSGVVAQEVNLIAREDDLLLTYAGAVTSWVDIEGLRQLGAFVTMREASEFGLAAGTQVVVLHNWYRSGQETYLGSFRETNGTTTDFASVAVNLHRERSGTAFDDELLGEETNDRLLAFAGDDVVSGLEGNDVLIGGTGDDLLKGGAGNDFYEFNVGDGADLIDDEGGSADGIRFGSGIVLADLIVTDTVAGLHLQVGSATNSDSILIADSSDSGGQQQPIEFVEFGDGTVLSAAQLQQLVSGNRRPVAEDTLEDQFISRGQTLTYTIPAGIFTDADGDALSYSATLASGEPLPSWLSFDPVTRTLTGTTSQMDGVVLEVHIIAMDPAGLSVSTVFNVTYDPDRIVGTAGNDVLTGTAGADYIAGRDGHDLIEAGAGDDELRGEAGNDVIESGTGDDWIDGGSGNDVLTGGAGVNTYYFSSGFGDDVINAAEGYSRIVFAPESGITRASWSFTRRDDDLIVTVGGDRLTITNWLSHAQGEFIAYRDGLPYTYSFASINASLSGSGSSPERSTDPDDLAFGAGESIHYTVPSNAFSDLDFDTGEEQLTYSVSSGELPAWLTFDPVTRTFSGTAPMGQRYTAEIGVDATDATGLSSRVWLYFRIYPSLNRLSGTAGADTLTGSSVTDHILGGAGDDVISTGTGGDYAYGEAGVDVISGGGSDDHLFGGDGDDSISGGGGYDSIEGGAGDDWLRGGNLSDDIFGDSGADLIAGGGDRDFLYGGSGDDEVRGESGEDTVNGGYGNDLLYGGSEHDVIFGDEGDDVLYGGTSWDYIHGELGDDRLDGGADDDFMTGGEGNDTFLAIGPGSGFDDIREEAGEDIIEFSADANVRLSELSVTRIDSDLDISSEEYGIRLESAFSTYLDYRVETFVLYDQGLRYLYSFDQLAGLANGTNTGPSAVISFQPQDAAVGQTFSLAVQTNTFSDAESQFALSYQLLQIDGTALPAWLTFDAVTRILSGTPSVSDLGIVGLQLGTQDEAGLTAATAIWVRVGDTAIEGTVSADVLSGTAAGDELIGHAGDDTLLAAAGADLLEGGEGNDSLNGGEGADWMYGGAGNDSYVIDHPLDQIREDAGAGIDGVSASVDFVLGANIENLTLTGAAISATGNALNNYLTGTAAANILSGGAGADLLDGGAGGDVMTGGADDDIYVIDETGDTVSERASGGFDTVRSSITYVLGGEVEALILTGTDAINATGNAAVNILVGNDAANVLNGAANADRMRGGKGNDTYVVDHAADAVIEEMSEGIDLVQSAVTYTLGSHVENLTLTGNGFIDGTGNEFDNVLTGNSRDNVLRGGAGNDTISGGSGNDAMYGGAGNDTFTVAQAGDAVIEDLGEGVDLVQSQVAFTLGDNIENLTLTNSSGISGTGNDLDNVINGNNGANTLAGHAGNDTLNGGGGADSLAGGLGNDTLTGGAGNDALSGGEGADIYSYSSGNGTDTIDNSSTDSALDRLNVTNLTRSQVTFSRSGNDLLMNRNGSASDSVRVTNWFVGASQQLDFVQFTDQTLSAAQINSLFGATPLAAATASTRSNASDLWQESMARFVDAMNHFGSARQHRVTQWSGADVGHSSDWLTVGMRERTATADEREWQRRTERVP